MKKECANEVVSVEDLATLVREPGKLEPLSAQNRQARDELALFFEQSLDLLCIANTDGYFCRLNPAWSACLGWSLEELQARPFLDFVHPDDRKATLVEIGGFAEGAVSMDFENRYRHRDGSYRWLRWKAQPRSAHKLIYATARDITRQKLLEREVLQIADQEMEHLGRELHDGLCQTLAGIAALTRAFSKELASRSEAAASAKANEIANLLNEAISEARDIAHGLGPLGIHGSELEGALEALVLGVQNRHRVFCIFKYDRCFVGLSYQVQSHLFRIAQEAVSNALSHGKASRIEINLDSKYGKGVLSIRDDGVGLPDGINPDGIGVHTMTYRAHLIDGTLEVRQTMQHGIEVICDFPLPENRDKPNHVHKT